MAEGRSRRRSGEETRRRILDAAEKRLTEGGPEAIRLQEIAADVGISHPAILHHFGSREGLVLALEARAMERLRDELLAARDATNEDIFDRVFETLGQRGHARLLAWTVLSGLARDEAVDEIGMLKQLADAEHEVRAERARRAGRPAPSYEDTVFGVRLAAVALFGDALLGPMLTRSAGLGDDAQVRTRFRRWLAELLDDEES